MTNTLVSQYEELDAFYAEAVPELLELTSNDKSTEWYDDCGQIVLILDNGKYYIEPSYAEAIFQLEDESIEAEQGWEDLDSEETGW